jgi:hypothetical protein
VTVLADAVRLRDLGERKVCATGDEKRPDSIRSPISASAWTARPASPLLNLTPYSLRAVEVGDRQDVLRAARELDQFEQDAAPGDVEREVDAVGRERSNPLDEAPAVGDGLGPQ